MCVFRKKKINKTNFFLSKSMPNFNFACGFHIVRSMNWTK
jgi:hypothetical protein